MDYFSRALQAGDEAPDLIEVQAAPVPRPAPVVRPGEEDRRQRVPDRSFSLPRRMIEPKAAPSEPPQTDYFSRAIRTDEPVAVQAPDPNAEPDAPTWFGRRLQDIRGKQDARYKDLPEFVGSEHMDALSTGGRGAVAGGILLGQGDEALGDIIKSQLGDRFVSMRQDANGYPIVRYRGGDGQETEAYVNKPGLNAKDVARGVAGTLPYLMTGGAAGAAGRGMGIAANALLQGAAGAGTSIATDVGAIPLGSEQTPDGVKALAAGGAGAAGAIAAPMLGAIVRRFITVPGLVDQATGRLTPKGEAAARAAGLDPTQIDGGVAKEFARQFAKTGDAQAAARQAVSNEFGIPRTQGEITGSKNQLLREQQFRGGTYGRDAETTMKTFDDQQRDAIVNAVRGEIEPGKPGIAGQLAPGRPTMSADKGQTGGAVRANTQRAFDIAKQDEEVAWLRVGKLQATPEAMAELDAAVAAGTVDVLVDPSLTPAAAQMSKALDAFKAGKIPAKAADILPNSTVGDVGSMRKMLLKMKNAAITPTDKEAAGAVYGSFLDWEVVAAEKAGVPEWAVAARVARSVTKNLHQVFEGRPGTPGARILQQVLSNEKNDSAEGVINALFSGPTAQIKNGADTALRSLKTAYDRYLPPDAARDAWNDIRLAHWLHTTQTKANETMKPDQLASAIKNMIGTQYTLMQTLYSPREISAMRRIAFVLDDVKKKNPNTSWSGIAVGALMRDAGSAVLNMLGWNSVAGRTLAGVAAKPVMGAYGNALATAATRARMQTTTNPLLLAPAAASTAARSQEGQ